MTTYYQDEYRSGRWTLTSCEGPDLNGQADGGADVLDASITRRWKAQPARDRMTILGTMALDQLCTRLAQDEASAAVQQRYPRVCAMLRAIYLAGRVPRGPEREVARALSAYRSRVDQTAYARLKSEAHTEAVRLLARYRVGALKRAAAPSHVRAGAQI